MRAMATPAITASPMRNTMPDEGPAGTLLRTGLIVLGLVVAGVVWFVRQPGNAMAQKAPGDALAELDMRLARGDIDAEDYAARKKLLAG